MFVLGCFIDFFEIVLIVIPLPVAVADKLGVFPDLVTDRVDKAPTVNTGKIKIKAEP